MVDKVLASPSLSEWLILVSFCFILNDFPLVLLGWFSNQLA